MRLFKIAIIMLALGYMSCHSSKVTTDKKITNTTTMENEKAMIVAGFLKGIIVASEVEGDCPFTIRISENENYGDSYLLDPINITEEFKKDGEKIWFTFTPLRMMNRCQKANPINLTEIQKREE